MSSEPTSDAADQDAAGEPGAALSIMVLYADTITHERALRIHDHMQERLGAEFYLRFTWWKADFLRHLDLFDAAVEAAVQADLIVFSIHASQRLPDRVEAWIDTWKPRREQRQSALVALLGSSEPVGVDTVPVYSALQGVARQAGMAFFPHLFPLGSETPCCLADSSSARVQDISPLLEQLLTEKPATPDWGINE